MYVDPIDYGLYTLTWNNAVVALDTHGLRSATSTTSKLQVTGRCLKYLSRILRSSVIATVSCRWREMTKSATLLPIQYLNTQTKLKWHNG